MTSSCPWPTFAVFSGQCPSTFLAFFRRLPAIPLAAAALRFGGILQNWGQQVARLYLLHGSLGESHSFLTRFGGILQNWGQQVARLYLLHGSLGESHSFLTHLPPGQNGCHFADDIFRYIFVNEKLCILIKFDWSFFLRVNLTITQHWFR